MTRGRTSKSVEELFWEKVDKRGPDECWVWTGYRYRHGGYGVMCTGLKKPRLMVTHRYSYMLAHGTIPADAPNVCHTCDNPPCVNPAHLFAGTTKDNTRDALKKGRLKQPDNSGSRHGMAKLNECDVRNIRTEYAKGDIALSSLAMFYDVRVSCISKIVNRVAWTHV